MRVQLTGANISLIYRGLKRLLAMYISDYSQEAIEIAQTVRWDITVTMSDRMNEQTNGVQPENTMPSPTLSGGESIKILQ